MAIIANPIIQSPIPIIRKTIEGMARHMNRHRLLTDEEGRHRLLLRLWVTISERLRPYNTTITALVTERTTDPSLTVPIEPYLL